jgi:hypothetical protein
MAEQLLHDANVGTAFQKVRRKGVPQRVRRYGRADLGAFGGIGKYLPGALT